MKYLYKIRTLNWASFISRILLVLAIILVYSIDLLTNTNMMIVLFSLIYAFICRVQLLSQWPSLIILVFILTLLSPGFLLLPLIFISQENLKLTLKVYLGIFVLISSFYLSFSVNVLNSELLSYLINNSVLVFGPLLILALGLLLAVFKKSQSYDLINIFQLVLSGFVLFLSAYESILVSLLSFVVFLSSQKILKGPNVGVVR